MLFQNLTSTEFNFAEQFKTSNKDKTFNQRNMNY